MGIGMCYARKTAAKDLAKRGAGLAFLFFALAKKFGWSDKTLAVIAVLSSLCGMLLKEMSTGFLYVDQFLGYIWGNDEAETYFPFLNWIIFPVFGYFFGKLLRRCSDKKAFYKRVSPICGVLGLGYVVSAYVFHFGMYGENGYYYFLGSLDTAAVLLLVIGIFGFCFLLSRLKEATPIRALRNMSANINTVYCIQWTLIGSTGILLFVLLPEDGLGFAPMTILAAVIVCSLIGQTKVESYLYNEGYDFIQELYEDDSDMSIDIEK